LLEDRRGENEEERKRKMAGLSLVVYFVDLFVFVWFLVEVVTFCCSTMRMKMVVRNTLGNLCKKNFCVDDQ